MTGGCADGRTGLGAYVLGALEPAERAVLEAHLAECGPCREELASLAALPGLLGRVSLAEMDAPAEPRPQLLTRLLEAAAAQRRRGRRIRLVIGSAAAAVVIAAGVVGGVAVTSSSDRGPAGTTFTATNPASRVTASVVEWPKAWGSALEVRVTGTADNPYLDKCQLVAVAANGSTEVAASWSAPSSGSVVAQGATGFAASDIARFDVVAAGGGTLVSIPASGSQS
jgi:hypothetical protein